MAMYLSAVLALSVLFGGFFVAATAVADSDDYLTIEQWICPSEGAVIRTFPKAQEVHVRNGYGLTIEVMRQEYDHGWTWVWEDLQIAIDTDYVPLDWGHVYRFTAEDAYPYACASVLVTRDEEVGGGNFLDMDIETAFTLLSADGVAVDENLTEIWEYLNQYFPGDLLDEVSVVTSTTNVGARAEGIYESSIVIPTNGRGMVDINRNPPFVVLQGEHAEPLSAGPEPMVGGDTPYIIVPIGSSLPIVPLEEIVWPLPPEPEVIEVEVEKRILAIPDIDGSGPGAPSPCDFEALGIVPKACYTRRQFEALRDRFAHYGSERQAMILQYIRSWESRRAEWLLRQTSCADKPQVAENICTVARTLGAARLTVELP